MQTRTGIRMANLLINTDRSEELCFACGQKNAIGLKIRFSWDGKTVRAEFTPGKLYQGWSGVVHGGIIACILDEAMNRVGHFTGVSCITAKMGVRFKRPARIGEPLVITSSPTRVTKRLLETEGRVALLDGTVIAESTATHVIIEEKAGDADNEGEESRSNA